MRQVLNPVKGLRVYSWLSQHVVEFGKHHTSSFESCELQSLQDLQSCDPSVLPSFCAVKERAFHLWIWGVWFYWAGPLRRCGVQQGHKMPDMWELVLLGPDTYCGSWPLIHTLWPAQETLWPAQETLWAAIGAGCCSEILCCFDMMVNVWPGTPTGVPGTSTAADAFKT